MTISAQTAQPATAIDPHPLAGLAMSGAEAIVQVLADEGTGVLMVKLN